MPQLQIPPGYRERKAAERVRQHAIDRQAEEMHRRGAEQVAAHMAEEREHREVSRQQMIVTGLGLDRPGREGVDAQIRSILIASGLGEDPVGTFRKLKEEGGERGFTFAGRYVQPHEEFADVLAKLPMGELETGALMARAASSSSLLNVHELFRKGSYFWTRAAAPQSELRSELARRVQEEREDPERSAVSKVLEAAVVRGYENLRTFYSGNNPLLSLARQLMTKEKKAQGAEEY